MHIQVRPSHVAILVPSVKKSAKFLSELGFKTGKEEKWDGEGTREIYVESDRGNPLLLMEPAKPGAYQRAMEKRGPGLHHVAIDVLDLESFLASLGGSGWLIHPASIKMIQKNQTAFLARPGFPALIEVQQKTEFKSAAPFVKKISIPIKDNADSLIRAVGLTDIIHVTDGPVSLLLDKHELK